MHTILGKTDTGNNVVRMDHSLDAFVRYSVTFILHVIQLDKFCICDDVTGNTVLLQCFC